MTQCPKCGSANVYDSVKSGQGTVYGMAVNLVMVGWKCGDCGHEWGFEG